MKFEIKACAWLGGSVLFAADIPDDTAPTLQLRAALELSIKTGAYLSGADLSGAYLRGADLSGAYLSGAYLRGAYLSGAIVRGKTLAGRRPYLAIGPLGSREDYLYAYITTDGLFVEAGCFFGTRDEFAEQVREHHGDNEHGQEYRAAIELFDVHARLWTPTPEQLVELERESKERADEMEKRFEAMAATREQNAKEAA